jgi:hypothetical protein
MGVIHHQKEPSSVIDLESSTIPREGFLELEMEDEDDVSIRQDDDMKEERIGEDDEDDDDETALASVVSDADDHSASGGGLKKNVSFHSLHIREYSQVLGDHPCCSLGPPVSLGWEVEAERTETVDQYEATRTRRRSRDDLRLSGELRRQLLSDVSDGDVRRVQRRLQREKRVGKGGEKAIERFFQCKTNTEKKETASE